MRTMDYRHASFTLHHVLLIFVLSIPMTEAGLITPPIPAHILHLPTSTKLGGVAYPNPPPPPPTRIPDLRRRQTTDTLGWSDPSTCNVGVCDSGQYCTVFTSSTSASIVPGRENLLLPNIMPRQHRTPNVVRFPRYIFRWHSVLVPPFSHPASPRFLLTENSGTSFPYCSSRYFQYGYGLGTFLELDCWKTRNGAAETTILNPSWRLYATHTEPEKGPLPTTTYEIPSSTAESSTPPATSTQVLLSSLVQAGNNKPTMQAGTIAGIAIGCIVSVALCAVGILLLWARLRRVPSVPPPQQQAIQVQENYEPKDEDEGEVGRRFSAAPVYQPQQQYWPGQEGGGTEVWNPQMGPVEVSGERPGDERSTVERGHRPPVEERSPVERGYRLPVEERGYRIPLTGEERAVYM
ncbi:hypothetical protein K440DRAFT_642200 [Wilcoxina mikolae CBS 423.85]|nr:hypothetical protein K440DRAFT_642200 [Wilcoxina mikolae CBS 423.85]